jgi:hypothetical protein
MDTQEIDKSEWTTFFAEFSDRHEGRMTTLQLLGADIGAQEAASNLPFVGITTDLKGSEVGSITIMLGTETENNFQHTLTTPTIVRLKPGDGAAEALEIESNDDPTVLLTFAA